MTQTVIHGRDVNCLIKIDSIWTYIGCAADCTFEFENEIILKTDRNAGLFRKKRVRISDSRASVSGVMTSGFNSSKASIFYFLQEGIRRAENEFQFLYIDEALNDVSILMTALVQHISLNADVSDFAEFDMNLEGTGGITIGTIEPPIPPVTTCEVQDTIIKALAEGAISVQEALLIQGVGTISILAVSRSGLTYYETTGTAGNLQFVYNSTLGTITFQSDNPGNPPAPDLEPVSIEWQIET